MTLIHIAMFRLSLVLILSASLMLFSCEKEIDVDLNDANPVLVIEGNVSDQPGPYTVKLTRSVNFDQPNAFPPVSGALVTVGDNVNGTEALTEVAPGVYQTSTLTGVPGRTYTLNVVDGGREYSASSQMYMPVPIDTVTVDILDFPGSKDKVLSVKFQDPAGISNYYRGIFTVNGRLSQAVNIISDEFQDGDLITWTLFDEDLKFKSADTVSVILLSLDEPVFNYYQGLASLLGSSGFGQSAAPANPPTNVTNGALGYFSAYAMTTKSLIIP